MLPVLVLGFSWANWSQVGLPAGRSSIDLHAAWDVGPVEVGGVLRRHLAPSVAPFPGFDVAATVRVRREVSIWEPAVGVEVGLTSALMLDKEFREGWPGWDEVVSQRLLLSPVYVGLDADPVRLRIPVGKGGQRLALDVLGVGVATTVPHLGRVLCVRIDVLRVGVAL